MRNGSALRKTRRWETARLAVLLVGIALVAQGASGAEQPASGGLAAPQAHVADLDYQEVSYSFINCGVPFDVQSSAFKKEPAFGQGKIIRGLIQFGGDKSNSMAFAWHRPTRKLYLDLNRNQDLTDDPAGVFVARERGPDFYQTFTNVHLPCNTASGKRQFLADLSLYDYGSRPNCTAALRSMWQGKITLQGEEWQAGIVENSVGGFNASDGGYLLLRPWEKRAQPFNLLGGSLDAFTFPRKIFVKEQAYQVSRTSERQGENVRFKVRFEEEKPALGELKLSGAFLQRVVLEGGPYLVVLDQPRSVVKVPVGTYAPAKVWLKQGATEAYNEVRFPSSASRIAITTNKPANLALGGPLTNSVSVSRHGKSLNLAYQLVGVGGASYQLANQDRSKPPEFTVHHAGKKVGSGNFEFG